LLATYYSVHSTLQTVAGDSFVSLSYLFRLGRTTIGEIVHDVCDVIASELQSDYLQASSTAGV